MKIKLPISVIIPTKNEEERLPMLLESINNQYFIPEEVIVSDAFSTDKTRDIAKSLGAKVVDGGPISVGRNNGAAIAKNDLFIFIDADSVIPDTDFFNRVYQDFTKKKLDIGSVLFKSDEESKKYPSAILFMNLYYLFKLLSSFLPKPFIEGPGFLISTREAFDKIGGFLVLKDGIPEDLYFMSQGISKGLKYKVLRHRFIASGRRYFALHKAIKALIGISMGSLLLNTGLHTKPELVKFSTGLYGELGGEAEKKERIKKVITIGAITAAAAVGIGLLINATKKKNKKK